MQTTVRMSLCVNCGRNITNRCTGCWKPLCTDPKAKHKRKHQCKLFNFQIRPAKLGV